MARIRYILRRVVHNPGVKLLALALALLLWFHVATDREYEIDVRYELAYRHLPDSLTFSEAPLAAIDARMRGTGKLLLPSLWEKFVWPIDLTGAKAGTMTVPLGPAQVPLLGIEGARVLGLNDVNGLKLHIDRIGSKVVPLVSNCSFETDAGHVCVGAEEWTPDSVRVTGPRTVLAGISSVFTRRVQLADLKGPVDREIELTPPPGNDISISPQRVRLRRMVEEYMEREYSGQPVQVRMPDSPDTFGVIPPTVSVRVGGPRSEMEKIVADSVSVVYVATVNDSTGLRRHLRAQVPAPLRVLKISPDSVTVWRDARSRPRARH